MKRLGEVRQLAPPPRVQPDAPPPLRRAQNACYEALTLALTEGHVFAALTGPEGSGKTTVFEAVLADQRNRAMRCIRISDADKVPASLAEQIEQVAYAEAGKPENLERHVVLAVDDAHKASPELLLCLSRLAAMREPGRRVPQVVLAGRPELWNRLAEPEFEPLARRLAIRAALPAAEEDDDPWAQVESEVTQTMTQLRAEAERVPATRELGEPDYDRGPQFEPEYGFVSDAAPRSDGSLFDETSVPPPSVFALFPDPPPAARPSRHQSRRRLVMPLVSLFVGLAAFAFALSFYDWPDLLGEMPWSEPKPSTPFVMPRSLQEPTFGLPLPPAPVSAPSSAPTPARKQVAALPKLDPVTPPPAAPVAAPVAPPPAVVTEAPARQEPASRVRPAPAEATLPAPQAPASAEMAAVPVPAPPAAAPPPPPPPVIARTANQNATPTPVMPPIPSPAASLAASPAAPPAPPAAPPVTPPPAPQIAAVAPQIAAVAPARVPTPGAAAVSPALVALLLRRGDEQTAIGDISAARLLYERAAESGSGIAAGQLARTYDPAFLPAAAEGALANLAEARRWYQRAAALGNTEAATRLKVLNQGR